MGNPTLRELVIAGLRAGGYDGLTNEYDCGCCLDDFMPCMCEGIAACVAGYKHVCAPDDCQGCHYGCDGWENRPDWLIVVQKPKERK